MSASQRQHETSEELIGKTLCKIKDNVSTRVKTCVSTLVHLAFLARLSHYFSVSFIIQPISEKSVRTVTPTCNISRLNFIYKVSDPKFSKD